MSQELKYVFIRLSALGAYLIFGPSEWALIRGGRLFEVGAYSRWVLIRGGCLFEVGAYSRLGAY